MSDDSPYRPRPAKGREILRGVRRARAELAASIDRTPYSQAAHADAIAIELEARGLGVTDANTAALEALAKEPEDG